MIENALYSILSNDAAVIALVSTRIYPMQAPQGAALPYIAYSRDSTDHVEVLGGSHGLARAMVSIESFATTYLAVRNIAEKVRLAIQGLQGTHASVSVEGVNALGNRDVQITPQSAEDPPVFSVQQDFAMWFTETVPS